VFALPKAGHLVSALTFSCKMQTGGWTIYTLNAHWPICSRFTPDVFPFVERLQIVWTTGYFISCR